MALADVSVICTAKNAASTIGNTIRSMLAQDLPSWEMIIVDDGSTDDTASVVSSFARADRRIKFVTTDGLGRGRALNRALASAEAELVANIDADDQSHPHRLRLQLKAWKQHPQYDLMFSEWVRTDGRSMLDWPQVEADQTMVVTDVTRSLVMYNPVCHSSALMRKAAIVGLGGYSEELRFVVDYDLWVRCAATGLRLGRLHLPLVAKSIHPGQSYLHSSRLRYLLAGIQVQVRAMQALGVQKNEIPLIALRYLWMILPLRLRLGLRDLGFGRWAGEIRSR